MTCRALTVDAVARAAFFCCTRKARSSVTASSAMWKALAGAIGRNKAVVGGWSAPSQVSWYAQIGFPKPLITHREHRALGYTGG